MNKRNLIIEKVNELDNHDLDRILAILEQFENRKTCLSVLREPVPDYKSVSQLAQEQNYKGLTGEQLFGKIDNIGITDSLSEMLEAVN